MKKALAIILSLALVLAPTTVFANTPAPAMVTGTGAVTNPTFAVVLPTAAVITVNPLGIGGGAQISSPWYVVANRSNVPIVLTMRVGTHTGAVAANQANFLADNSWTEEPREVNMSLRWATGGLPTDLGNTAAAAALQTAVNAPAVTVVSTGDAASSVMVAPITGEGTAAPTAATAGGGYLYTIVLNQRPTTAGTAAFTDAANMEVAQYAAFSFTGLVDATDTFAANTVMARMVFSIAPSPPATWASADRAAAIDGLTNVTAQGANVFRHTS